MTVMADKPVTKARPITVRIDAQLFQRLTQFVDAHEFPPDMTDVIEASLREFLDRRKLSDAEARSKRK